MSNFQNGEWAMGYEFANAENVMRGPALAVVADSRAQPISEIRTAFINGADRVKDFFTPKTEPTTTFRAHNGSMVTPPEASSVKYIEFAMPDDVEYNSDYPLPIPR